MIPPRRAAVARSAAAPPDILLFGAGPRNPLAAAIRKTFGGRVTLARALRGERTGAARLAVGFHMAPAAKWRPHFAKWAFEAGIPCLGIEVDREMVRIGPLSLATRAGCWNCARERNIAARAPFERTEKPALRWTPAELAAPILIDEIETIFRDDPASSQLVDHILAIDSSASTTSRHRVIPLVRCSVCGGLAEYPRTADYVEAISDEEPPEAVIDALGGILDWETGIVSRLVIEPPAAPGLAIPIVATAAPPHVLEADGSLRRFGIGWGKGLTISGAILSAVGEAIERYSPSVVDPQRVLWARARELEGEFLDPGAFPLYTEGQYQAEGFRYSRYDAEAVHPWALGRRLGGEPVWVPAIFAYLALKLRPEQLICQGTSSGIAAHTDVNEAGLRAVFELIERDALLAAWLASRPGPRIALGGVLDPRLRQVIQGVESLGAKVTLYCLGTAVCGTAVLCIAEGDGERYPGATISLGADPDPLFAVRQAVLELGQTGPHLRRMMQSGRLAVPSEPAAVREMLDHAAWYFAPERVADLNRLRDDTREIAMADLTREHPERSVASCAAALAEAGIGVALVDVTSPDIATTAFRVVRAVSPDLQPLWYGYGYEREPVARIRGMGAGAPTAGVHPIW